MCGIIAIINSNPHAAEGNKRPAPAPLSQNNLFYDMMLASAVRGIDGTGIFQVDKSLRVWTEKYADPSAVALHKGGMNSMVRDTGNSSITVGHVRAATQGSISDPNCHPFQAFRDDGSYIIGVHNGTLYGWDYPKNEFDVDSEWAFNKIAQEGVKAFDDFVGAFTFLWYDSREPGKLFIARNDERPFHLLRSKDGKSIYAASEAGMLQWLAEKHKVSTEDKIFSLDTHTIVSIDTLQDALVVEEEAEFIETTYNYKSYSTYVPVKKEKKADNPIKSAIVNALKECLRQSRYSIAGPDDSPVEMGPVDTPFVKAKSSWYSIKGVDGADISRATREGLYGSVVYFDAVEYDSFLDNVVGEIYEPTRLGMPIAYMNNINSEEASFVVGKKTPVVVVGARPFGNEMEYIVVPLTDEGKKAVAA